MAEMKMIACPLCGESLLWQWNECWTLAEHWYVRHAVRVGYRRACVCGQLGTCIGDFYEHFNRTGGFVAHCLAATLGATPGGKP